MRRRHWGRIAVPLIAIASTTVIATTGNSATPPQFGSLSNFDVFNDTGAPTNGFEIELDGITPSQVSYEFGAPYERYGNPTVTAIHGGVDTMVIYASPYDSASGQFTASTPVAPNPITPTMGHQCWTGGSANYLTTGCDHFGLGLTATPTNVIYNWLVANPAQPGQLMTAAGGNVPISAPSFVVQPAPAAAPNQQPIVQAVAPAPPVEPGDPQLADAVWVKVYVTETAAKADLGHLVTGDKEVPNSASQTEVSWLLVQAGNGGSLQQQISNEFQLGKGHNTVTQRYEFYKYTGPYDPENHEAIPVTDDKPSAGELGNLIGNQMVAMNLNAGAKADTTAPTAIIDTTVAKMGTTSKATVAFHATDPDSKTFTYYCALDKAVPAPCTTGKALSGLSIATHRFTVYAADPAGNASAGRTITWKVTKK